MVRQAIRMKSKNERQDAGASPLRRGITNLFGRSGRAAEQDVYARLRAHARRIASDEHALTLQPTELVNEAYARLPTEVRNDLEGHDGLVKRVMERIPIDRARRRNADKRGGGADHRPLDGSEIDIHALRPETRLHSDMDAAASLDMLDRVDPHLREVYRLRYENEITEEQAADVLGVPLRTLQRDSAKARGLLKHIARSGRE